MSEHQDIFSESAKEAVDAAIAEALGDAYDCTRTWSAWSHGTMGPDDFWPVSDDGDRIAEIRDAAIAALQPELSAIVRQRDLLLSALCKYGSHRSNCACVESLIFIGNGTACDCGFAEALEKGGVK